MAWNNEKYGWIEIDPNIVFENNEMKDCTSSGNYLKYDPSKETRQEYYEKVDQVLNFLNK